MAHANVLVTGRPTGDGLPLLEFRERVSAHLAAGGRLLTLFATPDLVALGFAVHAVLLASGRGLSHLATRLPDVPLMNPL